MNKYVERLYNGIIKENPTFVIMLGMCPTLAKTTSATNGFGMVIATTAVLIFSNLLIAALRNINGFYYMNQSDISSWVGQMFQFGTESVYTPMSLDVGLAWEYDELWWIHPTIALDFVDLIGFKDDTSFTFRSFIKHVNFGLELGFLEDHLVIRGGLSQGYLSAGLTVDLWAFKIDAAYYWREFGSVVGTKGVDALTVRLSFGWGPNF